jgi:hypothetical protein
VAGDHVVVEGVCYKDFIDLAIAPNVVNLMMLFKCLLDTPHLSE